MPVRFAAADTIVVLDPPTVVCLARAVRRAVLDRARRRPDLAEGCSERIDLPFLRWVWRFRRDHRPTILRHLVELDGARRIETLRSDEDIRAFLASARGIRR